MDAPFDKQIGEAPPAHPQQAASGHDGQAAADETTGASPGTAQACDDLGLNSLEANLERFGIKPPGMA
ncbi:MAG TPA: hypothetical protein DCP91_01740 [Eggerthellaceae bacterium]|nr:hypothetical protein [Eggerthellaceae bacterium]